MGADLLADQLMYNHRVLQMNVDGLTHDDSLAAPTAGGNCINWVVGHAVSTRNGFLQLLGQGPIWDADRAKLYGRGSEPVTAENAVPLDEILADFDTSQKTLVEALQALSDDDLAAKTPMSFFKGDAETVGSAAAAFIFHESYHLGQTGVLRRIAGKDGAIG